MKKRLLLALLAISGAGRAFPEAPRINGPSVYGARPHSPIVFRLPVTGTRPLALEAKGLPQGVTFDAAKGILGGKAVSRGTNVIEFVARNSEGEARRNFRLVVGDLLSLTPPLGFNTFGGLGGGPMMNEANVRKSFRALIDKGLADHGYAYCNLDDGWQGLRGGPYNAIQPNEKFGDMKRLFDEIHAEGLKAGLYSTPWGTSYQYRPGGSSDSPDGAWDGDVSRKTGWRVKRYLFDANDIRQFAAWGCDSFKYDWWMGDKPHQPDIPQLVYAARMSAAVRAQSRDIVLELSNAAPFGQAGEFSELANLMRTGSDLIDIWSHESFARTHKIADWAMGILDTMVKMRKWRAFNRPGHWNMPCPTRVGMLGGWDDKPLAPSRLTPDEQYTHISLWCLWSSPIIIGCPIDRLDTFTLSLLTNDEMLALDQDPLGVQAEDLESEGGRVLVKPLENGDVAVGFVNISDGGPRDITVTWRQAGLTGTQCVRDLWAHADLGTADGQFTAKAVPPHGTRVVRMTPSVRCTAEACRLPIVPSPSEWKATGQGVWAPPRKLEIQAAFEKDVAAVAAQLEADWDRLPAAACRSGACARVELRIGVDPFLGEEGYRLQIAADGIRLEAATRRGLFWATRSLLQLAKACDPVPFGTIVDKPRYRVRGCLLDVGRKYFPMSTLRALARQMAWYKMNEFHVHLSDDVLFSGFRYAAFRLQCDTVPGLTAKDGSYTKDEFRAFVKECAAMGINVVPEIDTPAHAGPILDVRPDLQGGWHHLDIANPQTLPFVKGLFDEYMAGDDPVFAGPDVHVGTDEFGAAKPEAFRAYADALFRHVRSRGKNPRAWGSFSRATGKCPLLADAGIAIDMWHNRFYQPHEALAAGYSLISVPDGSNYIVPGASYYHDYLDVEGLYRAWEPCQIADVRIAADHPRLIGGKFAIWNDLVGNGITQDDVFDRFLPAVQVIAEKTWAKASPRPWTEFRAHAARLDEAPGLNMADRVAVEADGTVSPERNHAIGWSQRGGWTVEFEIRPDAQPVADAAIFADDFTTVKLSQGKSGKFGFSRDGYDVTFDYRVPVGKWTRLKLSGTPRETSLWADGVLVKRFTPESRFYPGEKRWRYDIYRTLHFPLERAKANAFQGEIRNFKCRPGATAVTTPDK